VRDAPLYGGLWQIAAQLTRGRYVVRRLGMKGPSKGPGRCATYLQTRKQYELGISRHQLAIEASLA